MKIRGISYGLPTSFGLMIERTESNQQEEKPMNRKGGRDICGPRQAAD